MVQTKLFKNFFGNLLSLTRDNTTQTYMYEGNRLKSFNNGIQRTYMYNANGSMVKDGIVNIAYYENGMPKSINKSATEQVYYTFDAMGNKLRTNYYNKDSLYYYNDGIEYKGTVNPKLYYIATEDGYIDSTLQYNYYLKDHLGNIRKVLNATARTVTQTTNYYPFGLAITTTGTSKNKYLYNGKEIQPSNGYYDYGARMYDASVGRWFVVDAFSEKTKRWSPYCYTKNNPINSIDINGDTTVVLTAPDGAKGAGHIAVLIQNKNGTYSLYSKNGTNQSSGTSGDNDKEDEDGNFTGDDNPDNPRPLPNEDKTYLPNEFKTINEFMNSDVYNKKKNGIREYTEGMIIPTSSEQDIKGIEAAKKELGKSYNVLGSNCAKLVQAVLKAEGNNNGSNNSPLSGMLKSLVGPFVGIGINKVINLIPNVIYQNIKNENKGNVIKPN